MKQLHSTLHKTKFLVKAMPLFCFYVLSCAILFQKCFQWAKNAPVWGCKAVVMWLCEINITNPAFPSSLMGATIC
jgi:hypothetical protein